MERDSRRYRSRSHSRSLSSSRSRSRERHRHKRSRRDGRHKHSTNKHQRRSRSQSPTQQNHEQYHRVPPKYNHHPPPNYIKSEDNKTKFVAQKKSVKFDETTTKNKENETEKKKEDFNKSGSLKRDLETTKNGVVLKYNEPPEGTMCHRRWRLYVYKKDEQINLFYLHRQSFYLIGRDHRVTDIVCRHISVSSQHAVIQYRRVKASNKTKTTIVKPYIMDLKSRHGTYLMGDKLEPYRYYELLAKDKIQFGRSTREYIVLANDSNEKDLTDKSEIVVKDSNANEEENVQTETYTIWSDDDD
eukprot:37702_1